LHFITHKIQRCIPEIKKQQGSQAEDLIASVTKENVLRGIEDIRVGSSILKQLEYSGEIRIVGGIYDVGSGIVTFLEE
jgi:carbonic anhydrase